VQAELARRRVAKLERSRYSSRYVFSGKVECAHCKSKFERRRNSQKPPLSKIIWRCSEAVQYGRQKINAQGQKVGCNNKSVYEEFLKVNFLAVLNVVIENKELVVQTLNEAVRQVIASSPNSADEMRAITANIARINARKLKLVDAYFDGLLSRDEFEETKSRYNKQLDVLSKQLSSLEQGNATIETLQQKLANVETAIESLARLKEFGDSVCSEVLHRIIVDGRDKISFYLKTGENATMFVKMPVLVAQYQVPMCCPLEQ